MARGKGGKRKLLVLECRSSYSGSILLHSSSQKIEWKSKRPKEVRQTGMVKKTEWCVARMGGERRLLVWVWVGCRSRHCSSSSSRHCNSSSRVALYKETVKAWGKP